MTACMTLAMLAASVVGVAPPSGDLDAGFRAFASIPVQLDGRVAPFDTAARRAVWHVTGRESWGGRPAVELAASWMLDPSRWIDAPLVKIEHEPLKQAVGLPLERRHFSLHELLRAERLQGLIASGAASQDAGGKLSPLEQQAADISSRMSTLQAFLHGRAFAAVPDPAHPAARWTSPSLRRDGPSAAPIDEWNRVGQALRAGDGAEFAAAASALRDRLRAAALSVYPPDRIIGWELLYNRAHPFRWAWVVMTGAMVLALAAMFARRRWLDVAAAGAIVAGLLCFGFGFALRWLIAGRAPLSNMYESLVVFAGSVPLFALGFFVATRQRLALAVAAGLSAAGLVLADVLPLDASIRTLPPVLRNTAWLTIHVLTIMLGYGAAALSMGVAHVQIGMHVLAPRRTNGAREAFRLMYGAMLAAIIFLTAGIIFGAIWANASWGRYWGWDPKETWSLITLFSYLGVVHARYTGWLREFGAAVASIACFQVVLMTYYGVNYVLGAGLHSYGAGSGGLTWVAVYLLVELLLVGLAAVRYRRLHPRKAAPARLSPVAATAQA